MATPKKLNLLRRRYRPIVQADASDMAEDAARWARNRIACDRLLKALRRHHPEQELCAALPERVPLGVLVARLSAYRLKLRQSDIPSAA